jgi:hypothetical protein
MHTKVAVDRWSIEAFPSGTEIEDCPALFTTSCPVSP